ncbi:MAG: GH3 auxin-responsive promoter family protein, partial [Thiobacillus sp.]|nr:GH3 auxin-responsive promoter family protein [Thiobacillus sp.]
RPLARAARDPAAAQDRVLARLIALHRDSGFGRAHDYASIRSAADFRARVTVQHYDDLAPWIADQQRGEAGLTTAAPVLYALTSGTTGSPKYLPVTSAALAQHRRGQRLYTLLQYRACPEAFAGRALGLVGAAEEGRTAEGVPIGSVSGALYAAMPDFMRRRYIAPPEVFALGDHELKYRTLAHLALREPRLTYLAAANPSSLLRLQGVLEAERAALLAGVASGRFAGWETFPFELREALSPAAVPLPDRAAELAELARFDFASVWPELKLVATWTGGSCGIALAKLRERLPPACRVFDIGYLATEFRGTLTLAPGRTAGLPLVDEHYYEFVERDAWDAGRPVFLGLHELQAGTLYYVIVSTVSGLPRYFMNDLVAVDGWFETTPLLRFVQKGRGVTSITGEKLYEGQFLDAMAALACRAPFYLLLADEAESRYRLYLEAPVDSGFAARLDAALAERNIEYRDKRASGRLAPLGVASLKSGAGDAYKQHLVARGQREGQFKYLAVQYARECAFDFGPWLA